MWLCVWALQDEQCLPARAWLRTGGYTGMELELGHGCMED
jgi:hypothetical protein